MVTIPAEQTILLLTLAGAAAVFDFRERRIPNWLTISFLVAGLSLNALTRHDGWKFGLLGFLLAFALYTPLYLIRAMGAGDVKLMAAIGAIVGPETWIIIFLATAIVGGLSALVIVVLRGRYYETFFNVSVLVADLLHFRAPYQSSPSLDVRSAHSLRMPHGVSIAAGTLATLTCAYLHWL